MVWVITEESNEQGVSQFEVSDSFPNGKRTISYGFETLEEAESCVEEFNKLNEIEKRKSTTMDNIIGMVVLVSIIGAVLIIGGFVG